MRPTGTKLLVYGSCRCGLFGRLHFPQTEYVTVRVLEIGIPSKAFSFRLWNHYLPSRANDLPKCLIDADHVDHTSDGLGRVPSFHHGAIDSDAGAGFHLPVNARHHGLEVPAK